MDTKGQPPVDTRAAIASRLREARHRCGLTLDELAEQATVKRRTLINYEGGASRLPLEEAGRLAQALGVSLNWLCFGVESEEFIEVFVGGRQYVPEERRAQPREVGVGGLPLPAE